MKIIVVEDESVIRQGIRSILQDISPDAFAIVEFDNAGEAWTYMQRHVPGMVITDIRMREMDGLTLIRKIRQLYADLPVVIISGYEEFEYAQQAIRYKVTDYLLKPINRRALISLVTGVASRLAPQAADDVEDPESPKSKSGDNRRLIRKVKESIDANPDGDLRLQVLAEYAGINAAYLSQLFKAETGCNLSDYIAGVRLERAKHLLATTHLKIYDVAHQSGYQSPKHFMLVFKQHVGKTPSEYREQSQ